MAFEENKYSFSSSIPGLWQNVAPMLQNEQSVTIELLSTIVILPIPSAQSVPRWRLYKFIFNLSRSGTYNCPGTIHQTLNLLHTSDIPTNANINKCTYSLIHSKYLDNKPNWKHNVRQTAEQQISFIFSSYRYSYYYKHFFLC